jgi:hypothetical protein
MLPNCQGASSVRRGGLGGSEPTCRKSWPSLSTPLLSAHRLALARSPPPRARSRGRCARGGGDPRASIASNYTDPVKDSISVPGLFELGVGHAMSNPRHGECWHNGASVALRSTTWGVIFNWATD